MTVEGTHEPYTGFASDFQSMISFVILFFLIDLQIGKSRNFCSCHQTPLLSSKPGKSSNFQHLNVTQSINKCQHNPISNLRKWIQITNFNTQTANLFDSQRATNKVCFQS